VDLADPITECGDGDEAQERYRLDRPDWVLMDLMMPRMNGLEATRQIKAADPKARIVIVTGQVDESFRQAAATAGAFAFVLKDNLLDLRELFQAGIREVEQTT
jgi:CheY-like chemotaxis protein